MYSEGRLGRESPPHTGLVSSTLRRRVYGFGSRGVIGKSFESTKSDLTNKEFILYEKDLFDYTMYLIIDHRVFTTIIDCKSPINDDRP